MQGYTHATLTGYTHAMPKGYTLATHKGYTLAMPQDYPYTATRVNLGNHTRVYSYKAATPWIFVETTHSGATLYHTEFIQNVSRVIRKAIQSIAQVSLKTSAILGKIQEYTLSGFSNEVAKCRPVGVREGGECEAS